MTWKELQAGIDVMDSEQINTDVTVHLVEDDEFLCVTGIDFSPEDDVLDKNHPYLEVKTRIQ
jgi:hypothetical protein